MVTIATPTATTPLAEAKSWLAARVEDGADCPCCGQFAKVYRTKLGASIAWPLIAMYRRAGQGWVHVPSLGAQSGDPLKARHWNLIEQYPNAKREDGSSRVGWWRLTPLGVEFVLGRVRVPKYVRLYNARRLATRGAETISITEALGTRHNYSELMAGV